MANIVAPLDRDSKVGKADIGAPRYGVLDETRSYRTVAGAALVTGHRMKLEGITPRKIARAACWLIAVVLLACVWIVLIVYLGIGVE